MTQKDKGKNIFQNAFDAVSNRDEKAAIEAAMKHGQELETKLEQAEQKIAASAKQIADAQAKTTQLQAELSKTQADLTKAQADLTTTRSNLITAQNRATVAEQRLSAANEIVKKYATAEEAERVAASAEAFARSQIIAEHTLTPDETLSHMALKYYGSAGEAYWRVIYEANKELIGPNPGRVRPGMVIKIPVLPEELKKK